MILLRLVTELEKFEANAELEHLVLGFGGCLIHIAQAEVVAGIDHKLIDVEACAQGYAGIRRFNETLDVRAPGGSAGQETKLRSCLEVQTANEVELQEDGNVYISQLQVARSGISSLYGIDHFRLDRQLGELDVHKGTGMVPRPAVVGSANTRGIDIGEVKPTLDTE